MHDGQSYRLHCRRAQLAVAAVKRGRDALHALSLMLQFTAVEVKRARAFPQQMTDGVFCCRSERGLVLFVGAFLLPRTKENRSKSCFLRRRGRSFAEIKDKK